MSIWVPSTFAVATLTMSDGVTTQTVTDNGAGDSSPTLGVVTWIGGFGVWVIQVNTGLTKPAIGSVQSPSMDLNFVAVSSGAGTLTITFTDDGFDSAGSLHDDLSATTVGLVEDFVYIDGALVASQTISSPGGFVQTSANVDLDPATTLGIQVRITHSGVGTTTGDKMVSVPDGGVTVMLLGLGLVGLGVAGRKGCRV